MLSMSVCLPFDVKRIQGTVSYCRSASWCKVRILHSMQSHSSCILLINDGCRMHILTYRLMKHDEIKPARLLCSFPCQKILMARSTPLSNDRPLFEHNMTLLNITCLCGTILLLRRSILGTKKSFSLAFLWFDNEVVLHKIRPKQESFGVPLVVRPYLKCFLEGRVSLIRVPCI